MGWLWSDDSSAFAAGNDQSVGVSAADGNCSTSKVVRSQCKTEEIEPGKFVRRCEKTEEVLRHCVGKPSQVIHSNTEHTEEDVTDQMLGKPALPNQYEENPLNFPGLRSDIDAMERHFLNGMKSFFEAAEEIKSSLFDIMGDRDHPSLPTPSTRRGIPLEEDQSQQVDKNQNDENTPRRRQYSSGEIDLSGLAKDV